MEVVIVSIYLPTIPELRVSVHDRGIPNLERIVLQAQTSVQMEAYCLLLGVRDPTTGLYQPLNDRFFWFGTGVICASERILVYTGPGTARKTNLQDSEDVAYVVYWGQETTLLAEPSISPLLMKLGSMNIADPPQLDLPQMFPANPAVTKGS